MRQTTAKVDPAMLAEIQAAEAAIRAPGADLKQHYSARRVYPSSTFGNAALITWWAVYWTGRAPLSIAQSRGYTYRVALRDRECKVRVVDELDHRLGVQEV